MSKCRWAWKSTCTPAHRANKLSDLSGSGAIIVIERQVGLRNYIEGGIPLEAVMTYDLLVTIFQRSSPLHDGAAIVQADRVAAAACFLPLTTNPVLSSKLGTRHRAAIGITEETDCLSLVVSEETGRISVASFGELKQGLSVLEAADWLIMMIDRAQMML